MLVNSLHDLNLVDVPTCWYTHQSDIIEHIPDRNYTCLMWFHTEGGGGTLESPPPPPPPPEIEYGYYCGAINISYLILRVTVCVIKMLLGQFVPNCVRSNLRGSKFKIYLGGMPPPPSRHACLHTLLSSCYHPIPPPPPHLYETLIPLHHTFFFKVTK